MRHEFVPSGRMVLVPCRLEGISGDYLAVMAIDTGSSRTLIHRELLEDLGYSPGLDGRTVRCSTVAGEIECPAVEVARIDVLGFAKRAFPVLAWRFPGSLRIDGLLGLDYLADRWLGIDFEAGILEME